MDIKSRTIETVVVCAVCCTGVLSSTCRQRAHTPKEPMKKIINAAALLMLCLLLTSCSKFFGKASFEEQITGQWKRSVDLALPSNGDAEQPKIKLDCVDEYFSNKSATHICQFDFRAVVRIDSQNRKDVHLADKISMVTAWTAQDTSLTEKITESTVVNERVELDGQLVTDRRMLEEVQGFFPPPYQKGETWNLKTIAIEKSKWVIETDLYGQKSIISAARL